MLLRFEDIDRERSRPEYEREMLEDLAWLGLSWAEPPVRQSERSGIYRLAMERLRDEGLLYPCFCSRRQIAEELAGMASAPHGPDGPLYPGTCRRIELSEAEERLERGDQHSWRLKSELLAARSAGWTWSDRIAGEHRCEAGLFGDAVLARSDAGFSYHLCVVVDDADQSVDLVTRGSDLLPSTHLHRALQGVLGLPTPDYWHHALVVDSDGRRLAKRSDSLSLKALRASGLSAEETLELAFRSLAGGPHQQPGQQA